MWNDDDRAYSNWDRWMDGWMEWEREGKEKKGSLFGTTAKRQTNIVM